MKRASYREAVSWIALNDGNGDDCRLDVEEVRGMTTTILIADIFDQDTREVAAAIVRFRKKEDKAEAAGA